MGLFRSFVFLLLLYLLQGSNTSLVRLNNNGYEGIIIAIDPTVPEDETLIEKIKSMVIDASTYLFEATENRFFFKNVSILIPENWKNITQYKRPKHESYKHADVRVAPPTLPGRYEPYTKQFTACEEKGEYIHFTPDIVLGNKQNEFGPSGRLLVHEWAHLRWGVFDEYNDDEPFYRAKSRKIEATRCSTGITGLNRVYECQGGSCVTNRECRIDSKTKLYEKDCQFFPDKYQTEKTSIMFMQGIDSSSNRLNRMNQAAQLFLLQIVENGSWVGMVHFDSSASIKSNLIQIISSSERRKLLESLPTAAKGGTSICSGIKSGFQAIRNADFQIDGSEIVLLTDGEDNTVTSCIEEVKQSGAIIHFIALGPDAAPEVIEMRTATGGKYIYASDEGQNNGLIDAFSALASGNIDASQQSLQLESKGLKLNSHDWMNGTVIIDSTVGKDTFFLITWNQQLPSIYLFDPNGISMGTLIVDSASKMAYLNIPGITKVGVWTYNIQAKASPETLTITVNSRAANPSVPTITVNAKMNKDTNSYPSPLIVYAEILQGYLPILGANVTAFIESKFGETEVLELLDNGAGADSFKNDGVYSRYFTTYKENGPYNLKVRAHGGENAVTRNLRHPLNRAAYIPGWVVDGNIEGNPPRPENDEDTQTNVESFTRTATGDAFVVSNVPQSPSSLDLFPPSQITDLEATSNEDEISLTWTAPGDDFDVGKVQEYIIRISGSILDLRDNFDDALQVNTTALLPNEANSKETFTFKPGNISEENATNIFIAIQSVDKSNLTSKVSNIVQVALFVPQADYIPDEIHPDPSPDNKPPKSGLSISTLVLLVVGSVVIVSLILSITICILNKRRNPSRPRTGF